MSPAESARATAPHEARNPGAPLDLARIEAIAVDDAAATRRADLLLRRQAPTGAARLAALLPALSVVDLTTLAGDDTPERVRRLCAEAVAPLPDDICAALDLWPTPVAAVCVYPAMIGPAVAALDGTGLPVAAVAAGFPAGLTSRRARIAEIEDSVAAGAAEIDAVIPRHLALAGDWAQLYDDIAAYRAAAGPAHLKVILSTGELGDLRTVARAATVAMMAGADVIKTSTGKEAVNATRPVALTMARAIRAYHAETGVRVGLKLAGGISTADDALAYLALVADALGPDWLRPDLFRFGASSLLGDLRREIARHAEGAA